MVSGPRALKILGSGGEFPESQEIPADTVILDLPYRVRWAAFQQVRERYSGRLIVTVSSERETEGWPPDPACWFLVRPFGAEDVLRALRAPVPPGPSARAPLATRRRSSGREADEVEVVTAEAPPETVVPETVVSETAVLETVVPEAPEPETVVPETLEDHDGDRAPEVPVARLSTDESLWDVDAGATQPSPPPAIPLEVDLPKVHPSLVMPPVSMPPLAMPPEAPPPVAPSPEPVEAEVVEAEVVEPASAAAPPPPPPAAPVAAPAFEPTRWALPEPAASGAVTEPEDAAAPAEPRPWTRFRSRLVAEVVGAVLLVLIAGVGGIAYGRATAPDDRLDVSAIAPASPRSSAPGVSRTSPPTTSGQEVLASAASCLSALDNSDAAISYLVGNIRDDRLSKSIQRYQADRQTCRQRVR